MARTLYNNIKLLVINFDPVPLNRKAYSVFFKVNIKTQYQYHRH